MEKTNDNLTQPAQDRFKLLREYAVITAGLFLAALAIYFFMMPSNIIFGSITGLAMVLVHFIPVSVSVMTFILNLFCVCGKGVRCKDRLHLAAAAGVSVHL